MAAVLGLPLASVTLKVSLAGLPGRWLCCSLVIFTDRPCWSATTILRLTTLLATSYSSRAATSRRTVPVSPTGRSTRAVPSPSCSLTLPSSTVCPSRIPSTRAAV